LRVDKLEIQTKDEMGRSVAATFGGGRENQHPRDEARDNLPF
jgi:hypothetical protein